MRPNEFCGGRSHTLALFAAMLETMRLFRFRPALQKNLVLLFLLAAAHFAGRTHAQEPVVTVTPAVVEAGSPELIRVGAPAGARLDGEWLGKKLEFFRARDGKAWYALAGVDVEAAAGASTLSIAEKLRDGAVRDLSRTVEIHPAHYRTEHAGCRAPVCLAQPCGAERDCSRDPTQRPRLCHKRAGAAVVGRFSCACARPTDR